MFGQTETFILARCHYPCASIKVGLSRLSLLNCIAKLLNRIQIQTYVNSNVNTGITLKNKQCQDMGLQQRRNILFTALQCRVAACAHTTDRLYRSGEKRR